MLDKRLFRAALSSSYYCIFHTIRVLFALENIESKTHKGIAFLFDQKFIKTGLLPVELYKFFIEAYEYRLDSDYEDFYLATKEEAEEQIQKAEYFLNEIKRFIEQHYKIEL